MRHLKLTLIGLLTFTCGLALSGCTAGSLVTSSQVTGTLTLSSSTVDFGQVAVGKTASASITVSNQGSGSVQISQLNLSGQSFSLTGGSTLPLTVGGNASIQIGVQFDPSASGAATGELTVATSASNAAPASVALSGMGVPLLTGLSCVNGSMLGTGQDTCTLTLNATAGSNGLTVSLISNNSAVAVPASVTVPAGASSAEFTANATAVATPQAAMLTANAGGVAETFSVQLDAASAVLGINASSVAFGPVPVNSAVTQTLVLTSIGTVPVTVSAASLTGANFVIAGGSLPVTLAPGQTAALTVQFDPTAAGAENGQLSLASNSTSGSSTLIGLSGTGVPALTALNCSNGSIVGAGTDSCTVTVNAAAASGGLTINLSSNNSLVNVPASVVIPAGAASANFIANVSPVNSAESAILTATVGGLSGTFTLQLNASSPILTLSTSSIDFGDVATSTPATETLTLSSTGNSAVTVSAASVSGTGFAASGASFPLTLNPNQIATLTLQLDPSVTGSTTGEFDLTTDSSDGVRKRVGLTGRGVPKLSQLSCANSTMTGAGSDNCTLTTSATVPSGGLTVSLTSSNRSFVVPASMTIAAGTASGSFSATVSAVNVAQAATVSASSAGASASTSVQLDAAAISLDVSASSLSFGSVNVNTPSTQSLTLSSTGTSAVTVSAATVAGAGFSVSGVAFPLTLNAGQTATLTVQFDPNTAGAATGQLTLTSNSASGTSTLINLSGTGLPVLSGLNCASGSITGAGTDNCTVTLSTAAASGGFAVSLASNSTAVTVPASVTVAGGSTSASFTATVAGVSTAQTATLTASANTLAKAFALQLNAVVPTLSALSCTNGSFTGAGTDTCTVTLTTAAASGGFTVGLASNNAAVTVPASVTVPAGATTANLTATVSAVSTAQTVTLTASASGVTQTFGIQLGTGVPTLSINATSINFGDVLVNAPATQSVTLTSTGTAPVTVSAASVSGTGFSFSGATFPLTLNPTQTATLSVEFNPVATLLGLVSGTLTITSNSSTNPTAAIPLSATGESVQVNLTWVAPSSSPDPVAGYNVYRAPSGGNNYQLVSSVSNSQLAYTDTGVQAGQTYDYIVESVDATGVTSSPSNMASVTLP